MEGARIDAGAGFISGRKPNIPPLFVISIEAKKWTSFAILERNFGDGSAIFCGHTVHTSMVFHGAGT